MRLSDIKDFFLTLANDDQANGNDFKTQFARRKAERRRRKLEKLRALKSHFPLAKLPDELLEFIFRYIIHNYGIEVFRKLLENVPELQSKVLIVTDAKKVSPANQSLVSTDGANGVPRVDIRSYERSLTLKHHQRPLVVLFSFCTYNLIAPGMATLLTRFSEDNPYSNLINDKSIVLFQTLRFHSGSLHRDHNASKYLEDLVQVKARSTLLDTAVLASPFPGAGLYGFSAKVWGNLFVLSDPWRLYSRRPRPPPPDEYSRPRPPKSYTFMENSGIQFHFETERKYQYLNPTQSDVLFLSKVETELRYNAHESHDLLSWTAPYFQRPKNLRILMDERCAPRDGMSVTSRSCVERKVELGQSTGYENLHIEFLSPKMPLIIDNSDKLVSDGWLTARTLIIDNLNWTYDNPYGKVCQLHAPDKDQHSWSLNDREPDDDRFRVRCNVMMLIGITDRFLEYSRWQCVTVLYWRRLEPNVRISDYQEKRPAVISCPSLTQLKIFSIVRKDGNERAHFPQFKVPQLEKLVLVSLKDSERCWNVKRLLYNQWPRTLKWLTLSAHHKCEGEPLQLDPTGKTIPHDLRYLTIQRMNVHQFIDGPTLRELRYLELDITAIEPKLCGQDKHHRSINIVLNQARFPSLETLILSVPQKAIATHDFGTPLYVEVPETCSTVGLALMLSISSVKLNGGKIEFPCEFNNRPTREVFLAFVRDEEGKFVGDEQELMAECGRPLDTCLEVQWEGFSTERTVH